MSKGDVEGIRPSGFAVGIRLLHQMGRALWHGHARSPQTVEEDTFELSGCSGADGRRCRVFLGCQTGLLPQCLAHSTVMGSSFGMILEYC